MKVTRGFRISARQLAAHKTRTVLALVGIVIGVSSLIVMTAIGTGARRDVLRRIEGMGTNLLIVTAGQAQARAGRPLTSGTVTTLVPQDAEALVHDCPSVVSASPIESRKLTVRFQGLASTTTVVGAGADHPVIRNVKVLRGRFFSEEDSRAALRVAVLGPRVVANIFEDHDPLGETIRIGTVPFEVVGVVESKGVGLDGVDQDDQVLIPIRTALRRLFNQEHISAVHLQSTGPTTLAAAEAEVREVLRERHRLNRTGAADDFTIQTQAELIAAQREVSDTFTMLNASIAGVSLLIGGIGILAIMLIAIRERTREIGLRMAVGASRRDVRTQFLIEASVLAVGGGLAGILVGMSASGAVAVVTRWPISVSFAWVALSFGFSLLVGMVFGVYPATRASQLDPIDALRSE
jgi:putative ABC transport system permease protein